MIDNYMSFDENPETGMNREKNMNRSRRFIPTERTGLKRLPQRGVYERDTIYNILDEAFVCHAGFIVNGEPVVLPMAYGRVGNALYLHGSAAGRMLRALARGIPVCVTVTLLDGLVLARSAFHHSMNYRSVVVFGTALVVEDKIAKLKALRSLSEHVMPGRWVEVREPNDAELKQTLVLRLPLTEVSAKIRTGPPIDEETDYNLPVWAGELPLSLVVGEPIADPRLLAGIELPACFQTARVQSVKAGGW
jgi:nitroimidazol reductase NimA-like FMN-containing flavoprotein (pyridoxamine 5'-phosphate oxidase superfamily)